MTTETSSSAESLPHQTMQQISEIRYRRLFESARHGILLLDAPTRKIIDLNPFVTERFGYSRDELVGRNFLEVGLFKDVESCTALFRELLATGYTSTEDLLLTKAGQTRPIEVEGEVYNENSYGVIQLNLHELHSSKSHEDASVRLAAIVESSDDAIISKTLDGIITTWNAGAQNLYGYTAEEIIGSHMSLLLPPDLPQEEENILTRLRQGEHIRHFETRRVHKDGHILDVSLSSAPLFNAAGQIVGASAIARGISDLKQAQHALEQSERLYHLLASNFPNGSVMLFDTDLRLLLIEGRGLIHTESERKALIGQPIEQVMQPILTNPQHHDIIQLYQLALKGRESLIEIAVRGRERLVHIVPIRDEHQRIHGALGMSQDVTEKKQAEAELQEREERFRQLAENINEVFWMSDPASQQLLYVNSVYKKIWGRTIQSLYQNPQSFTEAIHPDDRAAHAAAMENKFAEGVLDTEYRIVHPDGSVHWIWDRAFPVLNAAGEMYRIVGIAQDITERKQAEAALQKERDFSAAVLETVGSLVIVLNAQGHVVSFNRACEELTGYSFDEVRGRFIMDLVLAPEEAHEVKRVFESIAAGQFPNQYENYWITKSRRRRLISWSNTAILGENGQVAFVIGTGIDVTERRQAEADLRQAHQKLQQAHTELEKSHLQLESSQIEVIERLAHAAEYRDDDTGAHTHRVGAAAAELARALGLLPNRVELIRRAAPMHDIGKIGIPDTILLKPGKLTHEEFAIIKTHTTIGAELLSNGRWPLIQMAELIARSHHERWDGTGYPEGLTGEEIPMEARIVAVVDVFDALTHERPYKKAWPVEDAVAEIQKQSGTQFDPSVVTAFVLLIQNDLYKI